MSLRTRRRSERRVRGPSTAKTAGTRAKICQAALREFLAQGFENTRMIDVADAAGVAKGTLYLYFPTKDALFEGLLTEMLSKAVSQLQVGAKLPSETAAAFLRRIVRPLMSDEQAAARAALFRIIITEGPRFPQLLATYRKVALDPVLDIVPRLAKSARKTGELESDGLERLPMLLLAPGLLATVWNSLFPQDAISSADAFDAFLDLIFRR